MLHYWQKQCDILEHSFAFLEQICKSGGRAREILLEKTGGREEEETLCLKKSYYSTSKSLVIRMLYPVSFMCTKNSENVHLAYRFASISHLLDEIVETLGFYYLNIDKSETCLPICWENTMTCMTA